MRVLKKILCVYRPKFSIIKDYFFPIKKSTECANLTYKLAKYSAA